MKKRFRAPSPALVISLIALFVALGGTSYAAITRLPANSVGTAQLKNNAVTGAKLAKTMTLAPGHTERGVYGFGARGAETIIGSISYPVPLASAPTVVEIAFGDPTPVGCKGTLAHPGAASGHLCIFEGFTEGGATLAGYFGPLDGIAGGENLGIAIYANGGGSTNNDVEGTWAVTG